MRERCKSRVRRQIRNQINKHTDQSERAKKRTKTRVVCIKCSISARGKDLCMRTNSQHRVNTRGTMQTHVCPLSTRETRFPFPYTVRTDGPRNIVRIKPNMQSPQQTRSRNAGKRRNMGVNLNPKQRVSLLALLATSAHFAGC